MGLTKEHAAQHRGDELWDPSWQESHGEETIKLRSSPENDTEGKRDSSNGHAAPVKLYTSWFCEFAHRAWIALEEKGAQQFKSSMPAPCFDTTTKRIALSI